MNVYVFSLLCVYHCQIMLTGVTENKRPVYLFARAVYSSILVVFVQVALFRSLLMPACLFPCSGGEHLAGGKCRDYAAPISHCDQQPPPDRGEYRGGLVSVCVCV